METKATLHLLDLPYEIILKICQNLTVKDIFNFGRVCRLGLTLLQDYHFWANLAHKKYDCPISQ
jgi:hypothetical protein